LTIVFEIETIFLRRRQHLEPRRQFLRLSEHVLYDRGEFLLHRDHIFGTKTLFSEAETIFFASETIFAIAEKIVSEAPAAFSLTKNPVFAAPTAGLKIDFLFRAFKRLKKSHPLERDRKPGNSATPTASIPL
jgi:hypothetical protein